MPRGGSGWKKVVMEDRSTEAGLPVEPFYRPDDRARSYNESIGDPGSFPFTRGNYARGYRDRLWTFRQYSGFGTAEESNDRYRVLLDRGSTGLSVALDLPTQIGFDSDDPMAEDEVGRAGVAIDTLADAEILFSDIPLDRISTSFTINGTAAIILAMYVAVGDQRGVARPQLRGTIQNDILKEYVARGTWVWPPRPSLRLIADTVEFCATEVPKFNAISVAGAHFRDAGCNAAQEMAFTLEDAITYCDTVIERGRLRIDDFASVISFFFYTHNDFFEEIAKYRAGRRRWAHIVKERYAALDPRSEMFRVGCVCGGSTLQAPQPLNNAIRVAFQAMASALGGVQSMFTAAWDEPFAIPTEESTTLALRTQQMLAYETGIANTVDPLGGSYFVESLTDAMDDRICELMADVERRGGMVPCIEGGHIQQLIADEAHRAYAAVSAGEKVIVGVNRFTSTESPPDVVGYELDPEALGRQLARLSDVRGSRHSQAVSAALAEISRVARGEENLMPALIHAVKEYCTLGEIVNVLKDEWGEFNEPAVF
jgi:methylmalonyl-CoA mutase N-terminal domain/subunit